MNVCERVEVEYKENNDSLSLSCYPLNLWKKIPIEKEKNEERKKFKKYG